MNREVIEKFQGKKIKLVLNGSFCLNGIIDLVDEDSILFTTTEKTSLIHFDRIRERSPLTKRGC